MNDRMVVTAIHILRLLSNGNLSTNNLIRQTSSDKSHVENMLKVLKKAKIITRNPSPEHKQMKINELDSLGRDFSEILVNVKQHENAFNEFIQSYKKIEAWSESDKEDVYNVIEICTSNICNILMRIYTSISNHKINQRAQKILDQIIFDSIAKQFSVIQRSGRDENVNMVQYHFTSIVLDSLIQDRIGLGLSCNKGIGIETKNLLGSLLYLMITLSNKENLSDYIDEYYPNFAKDGNYKKIETIIKEYDMIMKDSR